MTDRKTSETVAPIAKIAVFSLMEEKGLDVRLYDVTETSGFTDYLICVTVSSLRQAEALARSVTESLENEGYCLRHKEGGEGSSWILVDFFDVVINIFDRAGRQFYDLDRLHEDGIVDVSGIRAVVDKKFES